MIDLNIEFRQQGVIKGLDAALDKAVRMAQQDAARKLKSATAKYVSAQYWLTAGFVRKHITALPAGIKVSSKRLGLEKYKLSPMSPPKHRYVLTAAVKRSGGMKALTKRAFLWRYVKGLPFMRTAKDGWLYPVKRLVGPAIPQLVDNPGVVEHIQEEGTQTFNKRLRHYISRIGRSS